VTSHSRLAASFENIADLSGKTTLDKFCAKLLGTKHTESNMVVDCSCCATSRLNGDFSEQVSLQYGGGLTTTDALWKGSVVGQVPIWAHSGYVPKVSCVSENKPTCLCNDGHAKRVMMESKCERGPKCRRTAPPTEWPSELQEGQPSTERDEALGRQGSQHDDNDQDDEKSDKDKLPDCTEMDADEEDSIRQRISLGSANCEDASPEHCHLFYEKVDDDDGPDPTWHLCEANIVPKTCHAMVKREDLMRKEAKEMEAWAIHHAYAPGAWPVTVNAEGIVKFDKPPSVQEFVVQVDSLPPRILESAKI
jgi:hypothetical protein